MSENFKTWGEANKFCKIYDASHLVPPAYKFDLAEALLQAYNNGVEAGVSGVDSLPVSVDDLDADDIIGIDEVSEGHCPYGPADDIIVSAE